MIGYDFFQKEFRIDLIGYDICGLEYLSSLLNLFVLKILLKQIKNLKSLFADSVTRLLSYDELSFFSIEIFLYSIIFFFQDKKKDKKDKKKDKKKKKGDEDEEEEEEKEEEEEADEEEEEKTKGGKKKDKKKGRVCSDRVMSRDDVVSIRMIL